MQGGGGGVLSKRHLSLQTDLCFLVLGLSGHQALFRKILVSVKVSVRNSGGPEMAAPILWAPGKCVLSAGKAISIKFLVSGGGVFGVLGGGGECRFYFYGREDFSELSGTFSHSQRKTSGIFSHLQAKSGTFIGWSRMSGRTTSGSSRPSLGAQVLVVFSFFPRENRNPRDVWENAWKSQTAFFQTSAAF